MRTLVLVLTILGISFIASACSTSVSTANISGVKTCTEPSPDTGLCDEDQEVFSADTPSIAVTTELNNAPEGTELTFFWRYMEGEGVDIDSATIVSENGTNTAQSTLAGPENGWPAGEYEVVLDLGIENSESVTKSFRVE